MTNSKDLLLNNDAENVINGFRFLFDYSEYPIFLLHPFTYQIIDANKSAVEIYGYTYEEFLCKNYKDLEAIESGYETAFTRPLEMNTRVHKLKNDDFILVDLLQNKIQWRNETYLCLMLQNIRSKPEIDDLFSINVELLKILFNNINEAFIFINLEGKICYFNEHFLRITNYSNENILDKHYFTFVPIEEQNNYDSILSDILEKPENLFGITSKILLKNGDISQVNISIFPLFQDYKNNIFKGFLLFISDLPEIHNRDREIQMIEQEVKNLLTLHNEELNEQEEKFSLILESIPALIIAFDDTGNLVYANSRLEEITGYSLVEIYRQDFRSKIYSNDSDKFDIMLKNASVENNKSLEFQYYNKKGNLKWLQGAFSRFSYSEEKFGTIVLLLDIDGTKTSNFNQLDELIKIRETFIQAISSSFDGFSIWDKDFQCVFMNDVHLNIFGFKSPKDYNHQNLWNIFSTLAIEEQQRDEIETIIIDKGSWIGTFESISINGKIFSFEVHITTLYNEEKFDGCIFRVKDITDNKKYAETDLNILKDNQQTLLQEKFNSLNRKNVQLLTIVDSCPSLIIVYNDKAEIISCNKTFEVITNYSFEEIQAKNLLYIIHSDDVNIFKQKLLLSQIQIEIPNFEIRIINKKNEIIYVNLFIHTVYESNGSISNKILYFFDITDQKKVEFSLRKSEYHFRKFFDNHPDMIFLHDLHGKIFEINETAMERLKYSKEEFLESNLSDLGIPIDHNSISRFIHEEDQSNLRLITKIFSKDGIEISAKIDCCSTVYNDYQMLMSIIRETTIQPSTITDNNSWENTFGQILNYFKVGIIRLDTKGIIKNISNNIESLTGIEQDEWIKSLPLLEDKILEEDKSLFFDSFSKAKAGESVKKIIIDFIKSDNSIQILFVSFIPLFNEKYNKVLEIILIIESNETTKEDILSKGFFELILNNAPIGIITFNPGGKYTSVNEEFLKMLGYEFSRDEILKWNIYDLSDRDKLLPGFISALNGEYVAYTRDYMPTPSEHKFSFYQLFGPIKNHRDEIVGVLGLLNEITDKSIIPQNFIESEERYRKIFENFADIVLFHNPEGKVIDHNPITNTILGYSDAEIVNMNISDLYVDINSEALQDNMSELYSFGKSDYNCIIKRKDESTFPAYVIGRGIEVTGKQFFMEIIKVLSDK